METFIDEFSDAKPGFTFDVPVYISSLLISLMVITLGMIEQNQHYQVVTELGSPETYSQDVQAFASSLSPRQVEMALTVMTRRQP